MNQKEIVCLQKLLGKNGPFAKSYCHFFILSNPLRMKYSLFYTKLVLANYGNTCAGYLLHTSPLPKSDMFPAVLYPTLCCKTLTPKRSVSRAPWWIVLANDRHPQKLGGWHEREGRAFLFFCNPTCFGLCFLALSVSLHQ